MNATDRTMPTLTIRLPTAVRDQLRAQAAREGNSIGAVVRRLLAEATGHGVGEQGQGRSR